MEQKPSPPETGHLSRANSQEGRDRVDKKVRQFVLALLFNLTQTPAAKEGKKAQEKGPEAGHNRCRC